MNFKGALYAGVFIQNHPFLVHKNASGPKTMPNALLTCIF